MAFASVVFFIPLAALATTASDATVPTALGFWAFAILAIGFLGSMWLTYTEVGPRGLRVRTPTKLNSISWPDLSEVRWVREP